MANRCGEKVYQIKESDLIDFLNGIALSDHIGDALDEVDFFLRAMGIRLKVYSQDDLREAIKNYFKQ